ncbi:MAG: SseB family protein [Desulfuromusa sp.]
MTKLDDAIKLCTEDAKKQSQFYDLFLNSLFYVPVMEEEDNPIQENGALPLLVEANDKTYLMLFDTISRLTDWADDEAKYLTVAGHGITEMSSANIYWVLNYGTDHQKFFEPKEIEWLKVVVRKTKEKGQKQSTADDLDRQEG